MAMVVYSCWIQHFNYVKFTQLYAALLATISVAALSL